MRARRAWQSRRLPRARPDRRPPAPRCRPRCRRRTPARAPKHRRRPNEQCIRSAQDVVVRRRGGDVERPAVADAREAAAAAMQKVVDSLKANGIAEKDIQTAQISVFPEYDYDTDDERPRLRGYRVSNVVTVRLRQIDSAGKANRDDVG